MIPSADILNAKILIVDDQETNVQLLEQLLQSAGFTGFRRRWHLTRSAHCTLKTPMT